MRYAVGESLKGRLSGKSVKMAPMIGLFSFCVKKKNNIKNGSTVRIEHNIYKTFSAYVKI